MKIVFEQEALFAINKDRLYSLFASMESYGRIHPVITKIKYIDDNKYRVYEKVPLFNGLCIKTNYICDVLHWKEINTIKYVSYPPLTKVIIDFSIYEKGIDSLLKEKVEINGWFPVIYILRFFISKYHRILFKNLEGEQIFPSLQ
jgi:hypothetical protein